MTDLLNQLLSSRLFMPHGHCYLWRPLLVWTQVLSNGAIGLSYLAISSTLALLVYRIGNIPFKRMYAAFGIFIISCGITHFFDVWVIWTPVYWFDALVRVLTAVASVGTALLLPPLLPKALALAHGAKAAHARGVRLETMVKDLEQTTERATQLERVKTEFFANVSHELRTPLTLILGPIERLSLSPSLTDSERVDLDVVARNARTLLKQVNDLLDVSKLEAGKMELTYVRTDLVPLCRALASNFDALAVERGLTYSIETAAALPADVDPAKMQRILLNLLSNAFKFTPAGGKVRCSLGVQGARAILVVADSGPGIAPEQRDAVFERFRQLDTGPARSFGGTGLGLAIVKEFVTLHGGTVRVDKAPEGGAAFRVELPIEAPAGRTVQTAPQPSVPDVVPIRQAVDELRGPEFAITPPPTFERPTVLVVEDNRDMAGFIARVLSDDCEVVIASDGQEAMRLLTTLSADLIISDVMMPRVSGEALLKHIRSLPALDTVPVVMLTAKADDELRVKLLQAGAQDYIAKPFPVEELRVRVKNLVSTKRTRDLLRHELSSQTLDLERLAEEIAGKKRDLESAFDSLRAAHEQAAAALRTKTHFLNLVTHELRTPLGAMALHLGTLDRRIAKLTEPFDRKPFVRLVESKDRLTNLVDSLLEYARTESGKFTPVHSDVVVSEIAQAVLDEHRSAADAKGLELRLVSDPGLPHLSTDPRLLRLIVSNLVGNAVKFTETGHVSIDLRTDGERHCVTVADTGRGIAPEDLPRIFDAFTHLEPIQGKHTPGFGLGLALAREMVSVLGGEIRAASTVGTGSSFAVWLPRSSGPNAVS